MDQPSKYPTTFYRVSVKALITNEAGQVLVVKENQDTWSLPGGGLDHGEQPHDGLTREIKEELGVELSQNLQLLTTRTFYLPGKQAWLMWIVYQATLPPDTTFTFGEGVTAAEFIGVRQLDANDLFEGLVATLLTELSEGATLEQ